MPNVLRRCPVCGAELLAVRLECGECGTAVEGKFELRGLAALSSEQLAFVEVFVRNRGVIRDVEHELGVSYPTVRSMLDGAVNALETGRTTGAEPRAGARHVLERLSRGVIDVEEAFRRLTKGAGLETEKSKEEDS